MNFRFTTLAALFTTFFFFAFIIPFAFADECSSLRTNEEGETTTVSDGCLQIDITAGSLTLENIPDTFSFPVKYFSYQAQDSFSNNRGMTAPEDVMTVRDLRHSGGFSVSVTASAFSADSYVIPLENLYVVTSYPDSNDFSDATLTGTETGGVEYATGFVGLPDVTAPAFTANTLNSRATFTALNKKFNSDGDVEGEPVVLMSTTTAHLARMSQAVSFYLQIPASQPAGTYSTLFTVDLLPTE